MGLQSVNHANPYVGPSAFRRDQAPRFFGRHEEIIELVQLLTAERLVLLYSPSGAGKTSLIQAGILPSLEQKRFRPLPIIRLRYAPDLPPIAQRINRYLLSTVLSLEEGRPFAEPHRIDQIVETLDQSGLDGYLDQYQSKAGDERLPVLIFDQFEEVLTHDPTDLEAKYEFFEQLGSVLEDRQRWALFAMREDYIAGLDPFVLPIPNRLDTRFRLDLLDVDAARAAIRNPAKNAGVDFSAAAIERLLNDLRQVRVQLPGGSTGQCAGPYIEPVQLQVVCRQLWNRLPAGTTTIAEADIQQVGDVGHALAGYYAEQVAAAATALKVDERVIRDWFEQKLITEQDIRAQVLHGQELSQGLSNAVVAKLVDTHLVRSEQQRGAIWYELAHDRLINPVRQNNAAWKEEHLTPFQRQAALWDKSGQPSGMLLRGDILAKVEGQVDAVALNEVEQAFLRACCDHRKVERQRRRWAIALLVLCGAIIALLIVNSYLQQAAITASKEVEQQRRISDGHRLAFDAESMLDQDTTLALLLALEAVSRVRDQRTSDTLRKTLAAPTRLPLTFSGHQDRAWSAAYSPDGLHMLTASPDGTAMIWDAQSGIRLATLTGHHGKVWSATYSPDGTRIITASSDGSAIIWDVTTGEQLLTLSGHQSYVSDAVYSPDGRQIVTASDDMTAIIWDANTGRRSMTLTGHADRVNSVAYSPDGRYVVTASDDQTAIVWDAASGQIMTTLADHADRVSDAAYSPSGDYIVTASDDRTAIVWDAIAGTRLLNLVGHTGEVTSTAYSPDGGRIVTASADARAIIWDARSGARLAQLISHTAAVRSAAYSPDGNKIITASDDKTIVVWDASNGEFLPPLVAQHGSAHSATYSSDGTHMVVAYDDGAAIVWDAWHATPVLTLTGHLKMVTTAAYSPDGSRIVTASADKTAIVWDASSGTPLVTLKGHRAGITSATYSPDGSRIVTASADKTAIIWDASSGIPLVTLKGHLDYVTYAAFSPDGHRIVTAAGSSDRTAIVWDALSGARLLTLEGHRDSVVTVAFSPDGSRIITASRDKTAIIWDALTGAELEALTDHQSAVTSAGFSPTGSHVVTASTDGSVRIWEAQSGKLLTALSDFPSAAASAVYSTDPHLNEDSRGSRIVIALENGMVQQWIAGDDDRLLAAHCRIWRELSPNDIERFGLDTPPVFSLADRQCPPVFSWQRMP